MAGQAAIRLKRAYEAAAPADGRRVLIDGSWPRGIRKEALPLDEWHKEVAPSTDLRKWFGHQPDRWQEFRRRYWAELDARPGAWRPLLEALQQGGDGGGAALTLVYSARDQQHNNAVALKAYLEEQLAKEAGGEAAGARKAGARAKGGKAAGRAKGGLKAGGGGAGRAGKPAAGAKKRGAAAMAAAEGKAGAAAHGAKRSRRAEE